MPARVVAPAPGDGSPRRPGPDDPRPDPRPRRRARGGAVRDLAEAAQRVDRQGQVLERGEAVVAAIEMVDDEPLVADGLAAGGERGQAGGDAAAGGVVTGHQRPPFRPGLPGSTGTASRPGSGSGPAPGRSAARWPRRAWSA